MLPPGVDHAGRFLFAYPANALCYTQLARGLQDSLDRRNDAHKFERIKQRLAAEKYAEQLHLLGSEKEVQKNLRNAAFALLALLLLTNVWFNRQRYLRRQKEAELEAAHNDMAVHPIQNHSCQKLFKKNTQPGLCFSGNLY